MDKFVWGKFEEACICSLWSVWWSSSNTRPQRFTHGDIQRTIRYHLCQEGGKETVAHTLTHRQITFIPVSRFYGNGRWQYRHWERRVFILTEVCKSCIFEYPALSVSSIIKSLAVRSLRKVLGQPTESFNDWAEAVTRLLTKRHWLYGVAVLLWMCNSCNCRVKQSAVVIIC